ncbi:hypothetical protein sr16399 [Sporisorium reilianum SRZ2]|uniref:Uncharacterized protein n=1 Tax=Sporisorium reilianum (strain SRZ2) TaxID=999809 RepID=E6ZSI7_SPORE|nr:hypothetical protein sr16399 [Sporisorium reilianum SRZ2]
MRPNSGATLPINTLLSPSFANPSQHASLQPPHQQQQQPPSQPSVATRVCTKCYQCKPEDQFLSRQLQLRFVQACLSCRLEANAPRGLRRSRCGRPRRSASPSVSSVTSSELSSIAMRTCSVAAQPAQPHLSLTQSQPVPAPSQPVPSQPQNTWLQVPSTSHHPSQQTSQPSSQGQSSSRQPPPVVCYRNQPSPPPPPPPSNQSSAPAPAASQLLPSQGLFDQSIFFGQAPCFDLPHLREPLQPHTAAAASSLPPATAAAQPRSKPAAPASDFITRTALDARLERLTADLTESINTSQSSLRSQVESVHSAVERLLTAQTAPAAPAPVAPTTSQPPPAADLAAQCLAAHATTSSIPRQGAGLLAPSILPSATALPGGLAAGGPPYAGESASDCIFPWVTLEIADAIFHNCLTPMELVKLRNPANLATSDDGDDTSTTVKVASVPINIVKSSSSSSKTFLKTIPDTTTFAQVWVVYTTLRAASSSDPALRPALGQFLVKVIQFSCHYAWPTIAEYILTVCQKRFGYASALVWSQSNDKAYRDHLSITPLKQKGLSASTAQPKKASQSTVCYRYNSGNCNSSSCWHQRLCLSCNGGHPVKSCPRASQLPSAPSKTEAKAGGAQ